MKTVKPHLMCNQKGIAFVIAMVMLLVLTLIGVGSVSMTAYETNIAGNERVYNLSFYAADGGVENFRGRLSTGEFIYSAITTGSYQVNIADNHEHRRASIPANSIGIIIALICHN